MSRYRRPYGYNGSHKTTVTLAWDANINAYAFKFSDTRYWDDMQGILTWIKQTWLWNERDYDPDTKTWYLQDKHIKELRMVCEAINNFTFVFSEKPENAPTVTFVSLDTFVQTFQQITGHKIDTSIPYVAGSDAYDVAKKAYRKASLRLHPDRNPNDDTCGKQMSALNEAWYNLELRHFKTKERVLQEA